MLPLGRRGTTQGFIPSAHASGDRKESPGGILLKSHKRRHQWSSCPQVGGSNGMIYVFTPELQN